MNPKVRVKAAWILFILCILGWPISALTWAKEEPPFILGLSWMALAITALDIVATTDVRKKEEEK